MWPSPVRGFMTGSRPGWLSVAASAMVDKRQPLRKCGGGERRLKKGRLYFPEQPQVASKQMRTVAWYVACGAVAVACAVALD